MADVLVVGGGPAGAAAAIRLARAGRTVTLLEREPGPHDKVCGEFLSGEALDDLSLLGLDAGDLGAVPIRLVRLHRAGRSVAADLPFPAASLSRRVLDEALLAVAADAGAQVVRGVRVTSLERHDTGWRAHDDAGGDHAGGQALLATGKHDLKGWKRPAGVQPDLIGFKLHWRLAVRQQATLEGSVELYPFDGGYGGLEPVEGGRANLCLLVRRGRFAALGGRWEELLASIQREQPALAERLDGAAPCTPRPLAIAAIPYGFVARASGGVYRLGDQAAVIPSFSGDGQSIALHSARVAAEHLIAGVGSDAFQRRLHQDLHLQVARATLLSRALVRPWVQRPLFTAVSAAPALLRAVAGATRIPPGARGRPAV